MWALWLAAGTAQILSGASAGGPAPATADRPFTSEAHPPAPDYREPGNWAARPEAPGAAQSVPAGVTPAARHPAVDVFYIHPTTFRSDAQWNQRIDDEATNAWTDISVIARQASVFNGCCRIFAPRYRQASTRAFAAMAGDGAKAYDLAYGDVLRAFDTYLRDDNHGRPFILAGHSQGGLFVTRLLQDRISGTALAHRLVVAYAIGIGVSRGTWADAKTGVTPCVKPRQTGCVASWNSFLAGSDTTAYVARSEAAYVARNGNDPGKVLICTNLIGRGTGTALPGNPAQGPLPALRPGTVRASCDNGVLMVQPNPALALVPLPGGSMHFHDIALVYGELRADAIRRSAAFRKIRR